LLALKAAREKIKTPLLAWAKRYHLTEKGAPLNFDEWPFLRGLYADNAREIICMKRTQAGFSTWVINETWRRTAIGQAVFYVLPTQNIRNTFVKNRFNTSITAIPHYAHLIETAQGSSDDVTMKHIGAGVVKFVGSNAFSEFGEFPADVLIIDEYDRCAQHNLPYAFDRLGASKVKATRLLGNPTNRGRGIAELYEESDRRKWFIRCPHCNNRQHLDWFTHVVEKIGDNQFRIIDDKWVADESRDPVLRCLKCSKPIDRHTDGEWVAEFPRIEKHGYTLNGLPCPMVSVSEMLKLWIKAQGDETLTQHFYNSELGVPYSSSGAQLTDELLDRCCSEDVMPASCPGPCSMGIDVGSLLHVRISQIDGPKRRAVAILTCHEFYELDELFIRFGVKFAVIDALPEARLAREFARRHPGRVFLCRYTPRDQIGSSDVGLKDFWMNIDHAEQTVSVDRTQSLDSSHAAIIKQENILPKGASGIADYYPQMKELVRVLLEDKGRYEWQQGSKPDHYRHADNYDHIAARIYRQAGCLLL